TVSDSGSTITSLGFVDGNGAALTAYTAGATSASPGAVSTGLSAIDGGAIGLFADSVLGNRMVLGVDTQGDIVFAIFMDPNASLTSAKVWMVQFEALSNPNSNNPDDPVNLFDSIGVAATSSLEFNFNALPSGDNLFGMVGPSPNAPGLIVFGKNPVY